MFQSEGENDLKYRGKAMVKPPYMYQPINLIEDERESTVKFILPKKNVEIKPPYALDEV